MERLFLIMAIALSGYCSYAQTNTFPSSGRVGIGTINPATDLDVIGNIRASNVMYIAKNGADAIGSGPYFQLGSATGPSYLQGLQLSTLGHLDFWSYDGSNFKKNMRILNNGNIGIGTISPSNKVDVHKDYNSSGLYEASDIGFSTDNGGTSWALGSIVGYVAAGINNDINGYPGGLAFKTKPADANNISAPITRMVVDASGNVGIGTTNPLGYRLAINGSAIATSMTVKLYANWPDYVFKAKYSLPTLQSVKDYINQNHHLPDMPTEAEVAKNGLNLGEVNALLVKKVEELTLYLIEQQIQIKRQNKIHQKEINKLKKQIATFSKK